jgi:hypothetical protein
LACHVVRTTFLSAGLNDHDVTVSTISSMGPIMSTTGLPDAMWEKIAPDIAKKNPA